MVVLKTPYKVKGSSLVETITATVIIMIVFVIAIGAISNVLKRTANSNTQLINQELNKLEYLHRHNKIEVPDVITLKSWIINIDREQEGDVSYVVFRARNKENRKQKVKRIFEN